MRKIVDFIVEKRKLMLILFIIFAITCVILTNNVNINYDISEYLPADSQVRKGLDIMEDEFKTDSSSFNIMFKGLEEEQKNQIHNELKQIENVKEIEYDKTEDFNKDDYTLYKVTVNGDADSKEASNTYKEIVNKYKDYEIKTSGDVDSRNKEVLPVYILAAAVICGTIILIIMSDSVAEVFLFLFTILIAVLLNKGTNVIFPSVSNITDSISAILQLALSMDYSIILMNRFRQEQSNFNNKIDAMKEALYKSVGSISSSSVTTVVGLLALVFMSFTIGRDLGFVLAKGVICSLISTFFVLPGLILIFDKWIQKTKKKSFSMKFNKLGNISYKFRFVFLIIFLILFIGSYFLKGNLGIYYIDSSNDAIAQVFPKSNEIAIIYNNKDEEKVSNYARKLEENEKLDSVLCYGNTINDSIKYDQMNDKLKDLGVNTNIEDYLVKLIYYKKNTDETNTIGFNELITFINEEVYNNSDIEIEQEQRDEVDKLSYFTDKDSINRARNINDLSNILGIDSSLIKDLIIYYNSVNVNTKISIQDLISFINENVINNSNYDIDEETKSNIEMLDNLLNNLDEEMTAEEISNLFGISKSDADKALIYYTSTKEINTKLTINEFTNIVLANSENYKEYFTNDLMQNVKLLNTFSKKEIINARLDSKSIATMFNIDEAIVQNILLMTSQTTITPLDFVKILLNSGALTDEATIAQLTLIKGVMASTNNNVEYTYSELSNLINVDSSKVKLIYAMVEYANTQEKITPKEFINVIDNSGLINNSKIQTLSNIINNLDEEYTARELSNILDIDKENTSLILGLYAYNNGNNRISLRNLINFVCDNVLKNRTYSSQIDSSSQQKLQGIRRVITSTLNDEKHTSEEMINILSNIDKEVDSSAIEIIYIYFGSLHEYNEEWTMTIEELIDYLNTDIIQDTRFDPYIKNEMRKDIINSKEDIKEAKDLLIGENYSRIVITSKMEVEGEDVKNLISEMKENLADTENYIIGDSPMAAEMSETFNDELNLITILTIIFIFVVVAVTFRSLIIPTVLVLTIQCAVYTTMGILSLIGGNVYFISLLIVQAVLMGATIDYAIVYTTYYLENRENFDVKQAITEAYNKSIHTIITSSLILTICTLVVAIFTSASASKICETISEGAICATVLIIFILPGVLASMNKILKKKQSKK